jgi:hypothetical protein
VASRKGHTTRGRPGIIFEKEPSFFQKYRDALLFFCGMGGVFHETLMAKTERPTLLILFAAMMGLPAFLRSDEKGGVEK